MLTQMTNVGYDTYKSKAGVLAALKQKVAQLPAGQWIYAGYYDNVLQGGDLSMAELDSVSAQHPIFVYYVSMHSATANTPAFKAAGVTASTGELPGGGHFGKDAAGNLNGMIFEPPALVKFMSGLPKLTFDLVSSSVKQFLSQSAALGITMVHEAGAYAPTPDALEAYKALMTASPVRYSASPAVEFLEVANAFVAPYGKPGARALEIPGTLLSFYAVKIVSDGSPQQETAFQTEPYLNGTSVGLRELYGRRAQRSGGQSQAGRLARLDSLQRRRVAAARARRDRSGVWRRTAGRRHQSDRTLYAGQCRADRANETAWSAAEPPDE